MSKKVTMGVIIGMLWAIAYPCLVLLCAFAYPLLALVVPLAYLFVGLIFLFIGVSGKSKKYNLIIIGMALLAIAIASILSMVLGYIFLGRIV